MPKPQKFTITLARIHDLFRLLYFLKDGVTAYEASKIMKVDSSTARARLRGLHNLGLLDVVERDGKKFYVLKARRFTVVGFGCVEVTDSTVNIYMDPNSDYHGLARQGGVTVLIGGRCIAK